MEKHDYLADLDAHPKTTPGEAALRLAVSEASCAQAYRRARKQGFVEGDDGRPEKFRLTEAGRQFVKVKPASNGVPTAPSPSPELAQRVRSLEETVDDLAEDIRTLFRFAEKHLTDGATQERLALLQNDVESLSDQLAAFLDRLEMLEPEPTNQSDPRILEVYDLKKMAGRFGRWRDFEELEAEFGSERAGGLRRLVELELTSNGDAETTEEIARLREELKLAIPAGSQGEPQEENAERDGE